MQWNWEESHEPVAQAYVAPLELRPSPQGGVGVLVVQSVTIQKQIIDAIAAHPGITKTQLQETLGLASGTTSHHLRMLRRNGRIETVRVGRCLHLTVADFNERLNGSQALAVPLARHIVGAIMKAAFPTGPADLSRTVGASPRRVQGQLAYLVEAGLLQADDGYHPRYDLTEQGRATAEGLLIGGRDD